MHRLFTKIFGNPWFGYTVVSAFAAMIFFFSINGAFADKHKINGLFTFLGVACAIGAIYFLWKTSKTSTGRGG